MTPAVRSGALLLLATVLGASAPCAGQTPDQSGVYKGRRIADVMSYRGAPWLERATRIEEENPDALLAALPIQPGMLVVDLGCGSGYFARRMASLVGAEGSVICNDIQPEMLRIASELAARESIENMTMLLGAEDDPRLPEGEVDLILLVDVYHEFAAPEAMLRTMREALAPDGVIALAEFRLEGRSASHIRLEHRMSIDQVMAEWLPAGYELIERVDTLPTQHLFLFRAADD